MNWKKLGLVFRPEPVHDWMQSHAANPFAEDIGNGRCRVYFSARDAKNRSSIGTLELDLCAPTRPLNIASTPVLAPGARGTFDDSGLSMGCIVPAGQDRYLYYLGWNLGVTVPFHNSIGLAISRAGGPFERYSPAPILDRSSVDPFCLSYPHVLRDGNTWHLWYGSHLEWGKEFGQMKHVIKHAASSDGIHFERSGSIAIGLEGGDWGVSRPFVLKENGIFKMWFSRRRDQYRLGYAESKDGIHWERRSEDALPVSPEGWDSESVSYPSIFDSRDARYLLYCGNGYGRTGFGIAVSPKGTP